VLRAERNEERVKGNEIGISANVRDHLGDDLADHFVWDDEKGCYVAAGLAQAKLDLAEGAKALQAGKPVFVGAGTVSAIPSTGRAIRPAASHAPSR
jgi:hypothetical protein